MTTETATGTSRERVEIRGVQGFLDRAGTELGVSDWVTVEQEKVTVFAQLTGDEQEKVTAFAQLTGDEQWIHVDPERAADGPFGTTVQHGFFTLGLSTGLLDQIFTVTDVPMILNYGLNKARFTAPLKVGARTRMRVTLAEATEVSGGVQVVYHLVYEVDGESKPCCVADLVFRYYS